MSRKAKYRKQSYQQTRATLKLISRYLALIIGLVLLLSFTKFAIVSTYVVGDEGMLPSFEPKTMIMATSFGLSDFYDKLPITRVIERGDVVLLQYSHGEAKLSWWARALNPGLKFLTGNFVWLKSEQEKTGIPHLLMKRVIAVPGDIVKMQGNEVFVKTPDREFFVSEFEASDANYEITIPLSSDNWLAYTPFSGDMKEYKLGDDEYFVLGDNRTLINDSRNFGFIHRNDIHAIVMFKYLG